MSTAEYITQYILIPELKEVDEKEAKLIEMANTRINEDARTVAFRKYQPSPYQKKRQIDKDSPSSKMKKKKNEESNAKSIVKLALGNQKVTEQLNPETRKKDALFNKVFNKAPKANNNIEMNGINLLSMKRVKLTIIKL